MSSFLDRRNVLQLRWFRPKPGARRLLRFARAASRESRPTNTSQDWFQPLQAFVNRNFAAGSRIRTLLHHTLSLLTDKDRRTDCWIRRKQNVIRNNPDKSEFSNLLHCVLYTRLLILKAHVPSKKVNLRARWREIYCKCIYEPKEVVLLMSFICYVIRDGPTNLVSSYRVPLERETSNGVERTQGYEKSSSGQR